MRIDKKLENFIGVRKKCLTSFRVSAKIWSTFGSVLDVVLVYFCKLFFRF